MYDARLCPNQVVCGSGDVVIVTGWTPVSAVVKRLEESEFAAVGNLYSGTTGLDILVRHLLLNPHVKGIVALERRCEDSISGSIGCLRDFMGSTPTIKTRGEKTTYKFGEGHAEVGGDLPVKLLVELQATLAFTTISEIEQLRTAIQGVQIMGQSRTKAHYIPVPKEEEVNALESAINNQSVSVSNLIEGWLEALSRCLTYGAVGDVTEYGVRKELLNLSITIAPSGLRVEEDDYNMLQAEMPFSGLEAYKSYFLLSEDQAELKDEEFYTYAGRLFRPVNLLEETCRYLAGEPDTNRAFITVWHKELDLPDAQMSKPCLVSIQLKVINNKLQLIAMFRSHDLWGAWLANAVGLCSVQVHCVELLAKYGLSVNLGELTVISMAGHVYEHSVDNATRFLFTNNRLIRSLRDFTADPTGQYVRNAEGEVEWREAQTNKVIKRYKVQSWKDLKVLLADNPAMLPAHAAYLGWNFSQVTENKLPVIDTV